MDNVKFELTGITARQMANLLSAIRENDLFKLADYFAQVIVECPPEWGKANDPNTYLDLPYYTLFTELVEAMGRAGTALSKK